MTEQDTVLNYFREISKIPRKSGDEKAISDYLLDFAETQGLEARRDAVWNVIIKKPAQNIDDKSRPPLILQSHTDMVYVVNSEITHDYSSGIQVREENGYLKASGTTLGADNGMGVAYCLAMLASKQIPHPDLEVVFTSQEEVGLVGAKAIDLSGLKSRAMINMDAEQEGVLIASCAGGVRGTINYPVTQIEQYVEKILEVQFKNLPGGHSGLEIDKNIVNAISASAGLLEILAGSFISLVKWECPGQANAIASSLHLELAISGTAESTLENKIQDYEKQILESSNGQFSIKTNYKPVQSFLPVVLANEILPFCALIKQIPKGVLSYNPNNSEEVQSSLNLGALNLTNGGYELLISTRSSVLNERESIQKEISKLCATANVKVDFFNAYPPWEFRGNSPLREQAKACYSKLFDQPMRVTGIHGGLECSYFSDKIADLDAISIGANLYDAHTPRERMELESIMRTWELLCCIAGNYGKKQIWRSSEDL